PSCLGGTYSYNLRGGIAVDGAGNAYVTGGADRNFPTRHAAQATSAGGADAFVAKIDTVTPNGPPAVTCPPPVSVPCASAAGAAVTLAAQVVDPDGDAVQVQWLVDGVPAQTSTVSSGSSTFTHTYAAFGHTVTIIADDGKALPVRCSTTVTVLDLPPTVTCSATQAVLSPPNHALVDVGLNIHVTDDCDPAPVVTSIAVYSDEPPSSGAGGI